ncbi:prepilin-type N-terminal cleavage/methylation domain-containing protein [Dyella sp. A6]|uniref:prepilin-type N-terminal cleavage/methylation domain-containing protein n=1 Tax=Dyella aluminiiresistens TaxID=3069105 RepID=UPI002E76B5C4|nr:prepilin-type N-terminal cleavage/methylation domain-containing protein [Dyella sp. A6]
MQKLRGFTLVELMVAMLLGLIVIAGVVSVFLAGQQTYRTNDALGDVQESSRIAFELMARDIRDAGLSGCDNSSGRIANDLNNTSLWYADWGDALYGYDDATQDPALNAYTGTSAGAPVAGTSSIRTISTASSNVVVSFTPASSSSTGSPANFQINAATSDLSTGQLIMVCDFDHATIMQITDYQNNTVVIHNTGNKVSPGNCTDGLGYPPLCTANGNKYTFQSNARVAVLTGDDWYIGYNSATPQTTSLYRMSVGYNSGGVTTTPEEMVRNVTAMKVTYLQPPNTTFVTAANVTDWATVTAAQVQLTVQSTNQRAGTDQKPLQRVFTFTTTVRNRVQ